MIDVTLFSALAGGVLTFLAPCTLPLVPGYISFISDRAVAGSESMRLPRGKISERTRLMVRAVFFVFGFSVVFVTFGMASGSLGQFLILFRKQIAQVGGVVVILLGLSMLDLQKLSWLRRIWSPGFRPLPEWISAGSRSGAFLLGFLFALGWSPCLGPILGTILLLASTGGTALYGGSLLSVYSLGLALPFLLVAWLYGSSFAYLSTLTRYVPVIRALGGIFIVTIGFLLLIGQFGILNTWASAIIGADRFDTMVQYM